MVALMTDEIRIKDPIKVETACRLTGYSNQYVRRLAREEKIVAQKWGNDWIISQSSLMDWYQANRSRR